ncbi:MAG: PorV/PorQ family protein [Elusimicrobia bacterium]|nr:PorV/PorQ family protein [Elusimicrobiota bacterium]
MKRIVTMGLALLVSGSMWAGGNGGSAGAFLTLPSGARSVSMGEGGLADTVDANALQINPAAMAGLERASVVGTHGAYIDSSFFDNVSYVNPKSKMGAWGVGFQYFSAGSIDKTDNSGNPDGSLDPKDLALTGGYARPLGPVTAGAGLKYIKSTLVDTASTFSLDLGVQSKPMLKDRLTLGLVGQNLMGSLKYDQESNDLPMAIKAGAGYEIKTNWTAVADMTFPKDSDSSYSVGTEYRLKIQNPWGVALRGGYNTRTSDVDGFTGFSMGLGVDHKDLTVDYAFLPFGDVGTTHWITLGYKMGGK